jgi:hypothetical protein
MFYVKLLPELPPFYSQLVSDYGVEFGIIFCSYNGFIVDKEGWSYCNS